MAFAVRKDFGVRVAGEKAQLPDEFTTRSQFVAGSNISLVALANHDIQINALTTSSGSEPGAVGTLKIFDTIVTIDDFSSTSTIIGSYKSRIKTPNDGYGGAVINATSNVDDNLHYGSMLFKDITHNFDLSDKTNFLVNVTDIRDNTTGYWSTIVFPKVVGIDKNTIRIFARRVGNVSLATWRANEYFHTNIVPEHIERDVIFKVVILGGE